jgi:hypothetical protein
VCEERNNARKSPVHIALDRDEHGLTAHVPVPK